MRVLEHTSRIALPEPVNENPELEPVDIIVDEDDVPDAPSPEVVPEANVESEKATKMITGPQRSRFYAIAKESGKSDGEIKAWLKEMIGSDSTKDIPANKYEFLCNEIGKAA